MMAFSYGLKLGKYEILNKLGQGGYGIVYSARDTELGRDLAMKFLRPDYLTRPQVVQRFLQEARSAAKIVHPGIVTVYECGHVEGTKTIADGTVYIAMELLTGEDLGDMLKHGLMEVSTAVGLATQLAAALEAAHKNGVVHRDLKPDNIYLVPDASVDGGQRVKILDFGIAKLADAENGSRSLTQSDTGATGVHTHSMMMLGTPRYMSPEQCKSSARVDHRSDIYTLGCILFEMIAGKSPYDGDAGELIAKHQLAPVPRLRSMRPETPAYLDVLVSAMLAKDPGDRPQTMEKVREALARSSSPFSGTTQPQIDTTLGSAAGEPKTVVEGMPVRSGPPRWWFAAGGAAVVLAVVVGVLLNGGSRTEQKAKAPIEPAVVAAPPPPVDAGPDRAAKEVECRQLASERKWDDLLVCVDAFARMVPHGDPTVRELTTMSVIEARNATVFGKFQEAVGRSDMTEAYRWLDRIDDESVYKEAANEEVDRLAASMPASTDPRARGCSADKLTQRAQQQITQGAYTQALALLEASMRCKPDPTLNRVALLAACNAGNAAKAKRYFARIPANQQVPMAQLCLRNKIALP